MKRLKISTLLFLSLLASTAYARSYNMIFWYPGEAGTTEEAQPAIDAFFEYINTRIAPDKIVGKYFNATDEGLRYVKQSTPKFGIVSSAALSINGDKLGKRYRLLQTLPLPHGKPTERYVIVGKKNFDLNGAVIFTKQPITSNFLTNEIGVTAKNVKITVVKNILPVLKGIAEGTMAGSVLLQPIEWFTLKNIKQDWKNQLTELHISKELPTAPLIVFGEEDGLSAKIRSILLSMPNDGQGQIVLENLRLKGFDTPE